MSAKCEAHSGFDARLGNLEDSDKRQWETIDKLKNRLPVWATLMITAMGTLLGITGTLAVLSGKIAAITALVEWIKGSFC